MLGLATVARHASRNRSPSAWTGTPGLRPPLPTSAPAGPGDGQALLFVERAPGVLHPAPPSRTPAGPRRRQLELFRGELPLQPGLVAQHPWRRGTDWIPGHPNHRPPPKTFDRPLRRASDRIAADLQAKPESRLRRAAREVYDSINILVMGVSLGVCLLMAVGSGLWFVKSMLGIDIFPEAHTNEILLGGSGGGAVPGGGNAALEGLMRARSGGSDYPLMGTLGLSPDG